MSNASETTVPIKARDWMDVTKLGLDPEVASKIDDLVEITKITIELQVTIPDSGKAMQAEIGMKGVMRQFKGLIDKNLQTALPLIHDQYKLDLAGKEDAFSAAQGVLDKSNKYIKDLMDDFRLELRKAAAKAMGGGTTAKDLMTFGKASFKEMKLSRGAFNSEVEFKTDSSEDTLKESLKYKNWQYCAIVWNFGEIRVRCDKKKKLVKADIEKAKNLLPEETQNGAKFAHGMLQAFSESNVAFEFLVKAKLPKGKLNKFLMRGMKTQLEKNMSNVTVKSVNQFTAEAASGKKPTDDKGTDGKNKTEPKVERGTDGKPGTSNKSGSSGKSGTGSSTKSTTGKPPKK